MVLLSFEGYVKVIYEVKLELTSWRSALDCKKYRLEVINRALMFPTVVSALIKSG